MSNEKPVNPKDETPGKCEICGSTVDYPGALTCSERCDRVRDSQVGHHTFNAAGCRRAGGE